MFYWCATEYLGKITLLSLILIPDTIIKDTIYSLPTTHENFRFDEKVVEVFPDMIQRSIPGYTTIIDTIGQIAQRCAQPDSRLYDLGCSLGAVSLSMAKYVDAKGSKIIAVDNSTPMVERCRLHIQNFKTTTPVEVELEDIESIEISNASVVVLNFTLQFIPPERRAALLTRIYSGLNSGGVLILSEKVATPSEFTETLMIDLHHEFKRRNGYSELEISQKRSALENVMILDTLEEHSERLKGIGFNHITTWFKCFNFTSVIATKE